MTVRELLHWSSQTLTITSQSVRFVCASATGRAGNEKERNKQHVKKTRRQQAHILKQHAGDFPIHAAFGLRQSGQAVCCGGSGPTCDSLLGSGAG